MKDFIAIDLETANECPCSGTDAVPLVAYNAGFDSRYFREVFKCYRIDDPEFVFHDTLAASRKHFCGTLENHHHALADAEACAWTARVILAHKITDLLIQYGRID